ncbi:MAG: DUF6502 family protein [Pseudohongiella sp.]|nr:DUF6502 family protein [Pseudohongiella sp.]
MNSHDHNDVPGQAPDALIIALRKILRPIVRMMLHFQVSYPYLINLLKAMYVEVADSENAMDERRQSDSRITLLTGVHRKDVKRLRSEESATTAAPRSISVGAQCIAYWLGLDQFRGSDGLPLPLPLRSPSSNPDQVSFDDLVERVCRQDIRPRVLLDEWIRLGIAHQDEQDRVVLNTGAFTPDKGVDEKLFFFGKNIQDHLNAGTHNIMGKQPAFFDRSVYYDKLSPESLQELHNLAAQVGMTALVEMNRRALQLQQADDGNDQAIYRMNFGVFHYNNWQEKTSARSIPDHASTQTGADQESDHA